MLKILVTLAFIVCAFALVISLVTIKRVQNKELDKGTNPTTVKHPFLANPIIIANVLFPILLLLGGILWMYFYR
ncbi:hypothetical protein [Paenibacillus puerhi]|uniref:hypothetical protein n=1 Tax=Paenibacillus puerhi TaxID=2692622 RepID=UPI00135A3E48|nr:hypothetical protein [Paenibacillus puerhi]